MMFAVLAAPPAMADEAPNGQIAFDEDVCCDDDIWVVRTAPGSPAPPSW